MHRPRSRACAAARILAPARAASVAPLSSADLKAIYRLRYEVELPLAGASAGKRSQPEVTELDALLEAQESATDPTERAAAAAKVQQNLIQTHQAIPLDDRAWTEGADL